MNRRVLFHFFAVVGVATSVGCGGASSSGWSRGLDSGNLSDAGARAPFRPHRLWAVPDIAKYRRLLFISNYPFSYVDIYSMPELALKGQVNLSPLTLQGECADRSGDIWVTGYNMTSSVPNDLIKLAHDGTVLSTTKFEYGSPSSCAVDQTTGNLAVTETPYSGGGAVVIYSGGNGPGKPIKNPQQYMYDWDGYDASGNLWVDGLDYNRDFIISKCGASRCTTIPINGGTIEFPGWVQYAVGEKTWYVHDEKCGCIYPISGSGTLGTPIILTDPKGQRVEMEQGVITNGKSRLIFGDANINKRDWVARWNFPAGGPWASDTSNQYYGWGAAISQK